MTDVDGGIQEWEAAPLPGPRVDSYGAGDSFAAGLTYGLAEGRSPAEAATLGARCGAACLTGRGPVPWAAQPVGAFAMMSVDASQPGGKI